MHQETKPRLLLDKSTEIIEKLPSSHGVDCFRVYSQTLKGEFTLKVFNNQLFKLAESNAYTLRSVARKF